LNSVDELDVKPSLIESIQQGYDHSKTNKALNYNPLGKAKKGKVVRVPYSMAKHTIDRIIYPVQTKRGLKYPK
jgi:hypothetical protein